ncbi:MAG: 1-deoxy-D-xylulose-5-phosphate reductoisomerase [Pseudomonadota bacterium]
MVSADDAEGERRRISVLGATGSIGESTLDVLRAHGGREAFDVVALTAKGAYDKLADAAIEFGAELAVCADEAAYRDLRDRLSGTSVRVAAGAEAVCDAAAEATDWTMVAIAGAASLRPSFAAARASRVVALANKETMVCAGAAFVRELRQSGGQLLPVDSEHNAIFQVFDQHQNEAVERLILTASGGPFRRLSLEEMARVTPAQALQHPNWSMGGKITIDSATMFNKALEFIEAAYLFPVSADQIEVVVHPQSIVHSMVGYVDGSVLAQMGVPDMRTPIAYALGWPRRVAAPVERLDFSKVRRLEFEKPDEARFPALRLAREALAAGGSSPCALNASNEVAVDAFVGGRIGFLDIAWVVEATLEQVAARTLGSLSDSLEVDAEARRVAERHIAVKECA